MRLQRLHVLQLRMTIGLPGFVRSDKAADSNVYHADCSGKLTGAAECPEQHNTNMGTRPFGATTVASAACGLGTSSAA